MKYELNLDKEEYLDDYLSDDKDNNSSEFWQNNARSTLISNLYTVLHDAKKYGQYRTNTNQHNTWLSHNAILVTGPRGSGKTVFLRNTENMWKAHSKSDYQTSELYFLDVIDPTMLMNNDSFASVIIAQIYQAVSHRLSQQTCTNNNHRNQREQFHQSLKKLADSLGKTDEFNGCTGIDKILKYSSGIQIENHFHHFIETAIQVLGCQALVVSIDDVDMALDRAFEVVDDVRRFLGCPYIIPIVSGDLKLYEHMTHIHFDDKSYDNKCRDRELVNDGKQISGALTTAYLTKVFPSPMRISLFGIDKITPTLNLLSRKNNTESSTLNYEAYTEKLLSTFYFLCKNSQARKNWPEPNTARELTQLVRSLQPENLPERTSAHDPDLIDKKTQINLWSHFKNWAELKQNGEAFTNAESALTLLHRNNNTPFDILSLLTFNLKMQADFSLYPWATFPLLKNQQALLDSMLPEGKNLINRDNNLNILTSIFDNNANSLRTMPPLEFISEQLFVLQKTINKYKQDKNDIQLDLSDKQITSFTPRQQASLKNNPPTTDQILLDIYTHSELYSSLNNTRQFVFFSRAYEILFYSLISFNEKNAFNDLHQMLVRKPFYSIMAINQTKIAITDDEIDDEESDDSTTNEETQFSSAYALSVQIRKWHNEYGEAITRLNRVDLIAILSHCFNSSFTALNVIRNNYIRNTKKHFSDEHLTDMVARFKYNVLNAIVRASIQGEAIHANVAIGAKSENMRDHNLFMQTDRTYSRNKQKLEEQIKNKEPKVKMNSHDPMSIVIRTIELENQLHQLIENHPIFNFFKAKNKNNQEKITNKLFKLGNPRITRALISAKYNDTDIVHHDNITEQLIENLTIIANNTNPKIIATTNNDDALKRVENLDREYLNYPKGAIVAYKISRISINNFTQLSKDKRLFITFTALVKLDSKGFFDAQS